jgi:amino acid adenylation domain-containing protein
MARIDLAHEAGLPDLVRQEGRRPFDLARGPLLRAALVRLAEADHALLLTLHHIVADGWSLGLLVREVAALMAGAALPDLPVQYADFVLWQRGWLRGDAFDPQLAFWREALAGVPPLDLPADRPRPAARTPAGAIVPVSFPAALQDQAAALAGSEQASLFMVLMAAFQALLHRLSGQDDLAVGTPVAGRTRAEVEGLIGLFVNTLVLRSDAAGDPAFRELLVRTRSSAVGAFAHQEVPFERLVEELAPERDLARTPVFQVMFAFQNAPGGAVELPGLSVQPLAAHPGIAKFDLTLTLAETPEGLAGALEHSRDLYDAGTVSRLAGWLGTLLAGALDDPGRRLSDLPLLTAPEIRQAVVDWNRTAAEVPDTPVHRLVEAWAAERPRSPAVVADVADVARLTYGELNRRANRLAHRLRKLGVGPEDVVAVRIPRSPELIVAVLAVLKAGGAYLPIDPAHPAERTRYVLDDAGARLLLTGEDVDAAGESAEDPGVEVTPDHLAYVIYTSGSTGAPKGTELRHAGLSNLCAWHRRLYGVGPDDRSTLVAGPGFDASVWEVWPYLAAGAAIHLPAAGTVTSPPALAAWLAEQRITFSFLPTPLAEAVLAEPLPAGLALRALLTGGDRLHRRPPAGAPFLLVNHYGPTECTVVTTAGAVEPAGDRLPALGGPIANTRVYLLDRALAPLPAGVPGELCVAGVSLARGYRRRPALTAERFVPDPFGEPGSRLYRTGDLARRLPSGELEFLGRIDHQVKLRGVRLELGEIEAVLAQHPEVRQAAVLLREGRLVAYVGGTGGEMALRSFLAARVPEAMVPSGWAFLDALPLTPNGKVDRRALARIAPAAAEAAALRTPTQEMLAGIWAGLLGVERIGARDGFFALGGHSLLATRLVSRLRDLFGVELPLRAVFEQPTLEALAAAVDAARGRQASRARPAIAPGRWAPDARLPLSFAQERLWFVDRLEPGAASYSIPIALRLTGALAPAVLERSLSEIVRRHSALRATFGQDGDEAWQRLAPDLPFALATGDLRALPPDRRQDEARRRLQLEAARPFDLTRGPLVRALLLRTDEERWLVLLNLHHIVADGWSMGILVRELAALYAAFAQGRPSPLPDLPIQYADFVRWQRDWLRGDVLAAQLRFWREALAGAPTILELPADRPRPSVQTFRGARAAFGLPPDLAASLRGVALRESSTLFMVLLTALFGLLQRYTGEDDLLVGTPVAGRGQGETEDLIGLFVNVLVLRGEVDPAQPLFARPLARLRERTLAAFAHQDLPVERLVEEMAVERSLARNALYQVVLAFQNTPVPAVSLPGLSLEPLALAGTTAKTDLLLALSADPAGGLAGAWEYSTDLFDAATLQRLSGHFRALLAGAAADPGRPLAELPLLTAAEQAHLLREWNDTAAPAREVCLHDLFEERALEDPDAVALRCDGAGLTYGELDARANRLAARLRALGISPEVLVGIAAEEGPERVVAVLAVFKAGGAYLPLDPAYPRDRLAFMLEDSRVPVLLTQEPLLARLPETRAEVVLLEDREPVFPETRGERARPDNLAYVIYTSGSTGTPNGVLVQHGSAVRLIRQAIEHNRVDRASRILQSVSFSFDASVLETWMALASGATLCLCRPEDKVSGEALAGLIRRERVTVAVATPSTLGSLPADAVPTLRAVSVGGESCPGEVASRWVPRLDRLLNCYGPTETTIYASAHLCAGTYRKEPPIGRPNAGTRMFVLDPQGQPVPVGVPGELWTGGEALARGYLDRPGLTAERFRPDPFSPGMRLYKTGDRVRWLADGNLEFLGRIDLQVKIRGLRIELGEIEAALGGHPVVSECAVLVREEGGSPRLVAYLVPRAADVLDLGKILREHLRARLPDYMVPASFLVLPALPLTPAGKVDRRALSKLRATAERSAASIEPRDTLELELAQLWQEVLGVPRIGVQDDFFELGGHSLLAMRLMARIRQELGHDLPLSVLFVGGTVEEMARLLRAGGPDRVPPCLVGIRTEGSGLPFFCVHPAGGDVLAFAPLARALAGRPFYGLQSRGLAGGEPLATIEEMAALYLEEIRGVQPQGPYLLGGWSLGALIAFEMARQLDAAGEEVALLAVLDSTPDLAGGGPQPDELDFLLDIAVYIESFWRADLGLTRADLVDLGSEERLELLTAQLQSVDLLPPGAGVERVRRILEVYQANARAVQAYRPTFYPGQVTLFRAVDGAAAASADDYGWGRISGQVEVCPVPGTHMTLMTEPCVRTLAQEFGVRLEAAAGEPMEDAG